jgi:dehydrogenase/reductase SDR family member 7B
MKDKVVIITGGSSGIGRALAEEFGKMGSLILITGRESQALEETLTYLQSRNIIAHTFQGDVSLEEDNMKMAKEAIRIFGKIDILINNAGISMRALFEEVDLNVVRRVMDINFYGALYATWYCLPHIRKSRGSVIGISSIAGFRGLPGRSGYSASKFALNGFLEVLRTELLRSGVHVMTACPGYVATNIRVRSLTRDGSTQKGSPRDEKAMMTASECARHIYKATIRRKRVIILTTQGKLVVWLNKLLPGVADRVVYKFIAKEANVSMP